MSARSSPVSHLRATAGARPLEARGRRAPRRRPSAGLDRRRVRRLLPRVGRRPPRAAAAPRPRRPRPPPRRAPTLLVATGPAVGLGDEHVTRLEAFARTLRRG